MMGDVKMRGDGAVPLGDDPTRDSSEDRLEFKDIASSLSSMLDAPSLETPSIAAINGPWGNGKTSLVNMVLEGLRAREMDSNKILEFDAWQNDIKEEGAKPVIRAVANEVDSWRWWLPRFFRPLPGKFLSPRQLLARNAKVFLATVFFFGFVFYALPDPVTIPVPGNLGDLQTKAVKYSVLALIGLVVNGIVALTSIAPVLSGMLRRGSSITTNEDLTKARINFETLLHKTLVGRRQRFFIVIDNLDRCRSQTALDILDATKKILAVEKVVVILPVDMRVMEKHLGAQLSRELNLPSEQGEAQAKLYLEKIVNVQFDMPAVAPKKIIEELEKDEANAQDQKPEKIVERPFRQAMWHAFLGPYISAWSPAERVWAVKDPEESPHYEGMFLSGWAFILWIGTGAFIANLAAAILRFIEEKILADYYPHGERYPHAAPNSLPTPGIWQRGFLLLSIVVWGYLFWPYAYFIPHKASLFGFIFYGMIGCMFAAWGLWIRNIKACYQKDRKRLDEIQQTGLEDARKKAVKSEEEMPELEPGRIGKEQARAWYITGAFREQSGLVLTRSNQAHLLDFLHPNPRQVKRFKNRVRIIKLIVENRKGMKSASGIADEHITKWAVLEERWPAHARDIRNNPHLLADYESKETIQLEKSISDDLFRRFLGTEPKLAGQAPFLATLSATPFHGVLPSPDG